VSVRRDLCAGEDANNTDEAERPYSGERGKHGCVDKQHKAATDSIDVATVKQTFGKSVPTLRLIVSKEEFSFVRSDKMIHEASQLMSKTLLAGDGRNVKPQELFFRVLQLSDAAIGTLGYRMFVLLGLLT
jgi:hypothetical protein